MEIRELSPGDVHWVVRSDALFDDPTEPGAAEAYLADPANVFFLALDGERPIGFARGTVLRQLKTRRGQMFLYEIAVDPAHQRRGVGRALVVRLLEYCRAHDLEEAFVFTDPGNAAAVGLYRATGAVTETPADRMFVYALPAAPGRPRRASASHATRAHGAKIVK